MQTIPTFIPDNVIGKAVDLQYAFTASKSAAAIERFQSAASLLLQPHRWHDLAGFASASFVIMGNDGTPAPPRDLQEGDVIRIDVPGMGPVNGSGYDWVKVETLQKNAVAGYAQSVVVILRPTSNPLKNETTIAHFFSERSRSVFVLTRINYQVHISYHGRNEVSNTTDVDWMDKIRNGVVAAGALAGFSNMQWRSLIKNILTTDDDVLSEQQPQQRDLSF